MQFKVTDHKPFNGTYYSPDEYEKLRLGMFTSSHNTPPSLGKPPLIFHRIYIINVFKQGDEFFQEAWNSPADLKLSPDEAFKLYLEWFDLENHRYRTSEQGDWKKYNAFMPRTQVPEDYKDVIRHIGI